MIYRVPTKINTGGHRQCKRVVRISLRVPILRRYVRAPRSHPWRQHSHDTQLSHEPSGCANRHTPVVARRTADFADKGLAQNRMHFLIRTPLLVVVPSSSRLRLGHEVACASSMTHGLLVTCRPCPWPSCRCQRCRPQHYHHLGRHHRRHPADAEPAVLHSQHHSSVGLEAAGPPASQRLLCPLGGIQQVQVVRVRQDWTWSWVPCPTERAEPCLAASWHLHWGRQPRWRASAIHSAVRHPVRSSSPPARVA